MEINNFSLLLTGDLRRLYLNQKAKRIIAIIPQIWSEIYPWGTGSLRSGLKKENRL